MLELARWPVFVVGAPRSGTTLLAASLAAHPEVRGGPETHFYDKLGAGARKRAVTDKAWPAAAVSALKSLTLAGQRVIDLFDVTEHEIREYLLEAPRASASVLAALFEANEMPSQRRPWVEKTPNHLLHLAELSADFPEATVIHIVRDPRDVAASMVGLPWASPSRVGNAWLWRDWEEQAGPHLSALGARLLTVRYEDYLADPSATLRLISSHIGLEFRKEMLHPELAAASVTTAAEVWKEKNFTPIDASRGSAWRSRDDDLDHAIAALCSSQMAKYGYEGPDPDQLQDAPFASMSFQLAGALESAIVAATKVGVRPVGAGVLAPERTWVWSPAEALRACGPKAAIQLVVTLTGRVALRLPTDVFRLKGALT